MLFKLLSATLKWKCHIILMTFSSSTAHKDIKMTTSGAPNDENVIKVMMFPFQWRSPPSRSRERRVEIEETTLTAITHGYYYENPTKLAGKNCCSTSTKIPNWNFIIFIKPLRCPKSDMCHSALSGQISYLSLNGPTIISTKQKLSICISWIPNVHLYEQKDQINELKKWC